MDKINYYELLGVEENASSEEIKRAFAKKRKEFYQDKEKTTLLNKAYETLKDSKLHAQYNAESKYGSKVSELWEKYNNADSNKEATKWLEELQHIYQQMLSDNEHDIIVLKNLYEIEKELDRKEELQYLDKIVVQIANIESEIDKKKWLKYIGEQYYEYEKYDDVIKAYYQYYKIDVEDTDVICNLVNLVNNKKKQYKASIQLLNDCINRSNNKVIKIRYLCKAYIVSSNMEGEVYNKVKEVLLKNITGYKDEEEPEKTQIAIQILSAMCECIDQKNDESYSKLENIYLQYNIDNEAVDEYYEMVKQLKAVVVAGKCHEVMDLFYEHPWTDKIRFKINEFMLSDIENIKSSIEYIKQHAPLFWELNKEENEKAELLINQDYLKIKEYQKLINNPDLSNELKRIINILISDGIIRFQKLESEYIRNRDLLFSDTHINKSRQEIILLERLYPTCYQMFSDVFFNGKSTKELLGDEYKDSNIKKNMSDPKSKEIQRKNKYIKFLTMLVCIIIVIVFISKISTAIKDCLDAEQEQAYKESHNYFLSDSDKEKRDTLEHKNNHTILPDLVGMEIEKAQKIAEANGFIIDISESKYSDEYDAGEITYQYINPEIEIQKGTYVYVDVSLGKDERVSVPDLVGLTIDEARQRLDCMGLRIDIENEEYSNEYNKDCIIFQDTQEGTLVYNNETIYVGISLGEKVPIKVYPQQYFDIQRISTENSLTVEDVLRYFMINEKFCTVNMNTTVNGYSEYIISFPSSLYDIDGITNCELYIPDDVEESCLIFFEWIPNESFAFDLIHDSLLNNGFEKEKVNRGILVASKDGEVMISAYSDGRCYVRFSTY